MFVLSSLCARCVLKVIRYGGSRHTTAVLQRGLDSVLLPPSMYFPALYCTLLYYSAPYLTVRYCTVPYCTVLYTAKQVSRQSHRQSPENWCFMVCRSHNSQLVPGVPPNHAYAPSPLGSMGSLAQAVIDRVRGARGAGDSPRAETGRRSLSLLSRGVFRRDSCPSTPLAGGGSGQDPSLSYGGCWQPVNS